MQNKVVRLICNVKKKTSCRELFKKLNILPVPCVYIMEMVHYIKINICIHIVSDRKFLLPGEHNLLTNCSLYAVLVTKYW